MLDAGERNEGDTTFVMMVNLCDIFHINIVFSSSPVARS
jgi:hypothetical protein